MKHNVKSICGFEISALDGEIGMIKEFYFDDKTWTVRYLVVETGSWLSGKTVLISPEMLIRLDLSNCIFYVNLTKEQVKNSPDIESIKPVSRQEEGKLISHYGIENYWEGSIWPGGIGTSGMMMPGYAPFEEEIEKAIDEKGGKTKGDPHLRSTAKVTGYGIHEADGTIGDVADFVIDLNSWKLVFMIVDAGNWLHKKEVLISTGMVTKIKWSTSEVFINASVENVKRSQEYDASRPFNEIFM